MELVGLTDAARRLGVAPNTVWRWSRLDGFPKPAGRVSGRNVWQYADLERWHRERTVDRGGRPPKS